MSKLEALDQVAEWMARAFRDKPWCLSEGCSSCVRDYQDYLKARHQLESLRPAPGAHK